MAYKVVICGHEEYRNGHCGRIGCSYYLSNCGLHALAKTGDTCNLERYARYEWLVEELFVDSPAPEVVMFHVIVVARNYALAFELANREAEIHTGGKRFLCEASDLGEVDKGYLWAYGESPSLYTVRRLREVPVWTIHGPVAFQVPNESATPR
jgi:hypothetical protein